MTRLRRKPKPTPRHVHAKVRPLTKRQKTAVLERDDYTCQRCGLDCRAAESALLAARDRVSRTGAYLLTPRDHRHEFVAREAGVSEVVAFKVLRLRQSAAEVDHIVPRSEQGTNDPENLRTLCADCHAEKSADDTSRIARLPSTRRAEGTR